MNPQAIASSQKNRLEIFMLGAFRLVIDGTPVEDRLWTRRKSKTLIKLLALQSNHQLHREQLIEYLWPEQESEAGLNNLHKTIHAARRTLEPELKSGADSQFIVTQDQLIVLRAPDGLLVDVEEFELRAATALKSNEPADGETALELYGGDLLGEDLYEDWAAVRREKLRMLYEQLLQHLAQLYKFKGEYQLSIERLNQLLTVNQTNEEAHRNLIRLYAASGNRHQAMQQYQLCRDALRRDLDAEPEPATVKLHEQITAVTVEDEPVSFNIVADEKHVAANNDEALTTAGIAITPRSKSFSDDRPRQYGRRSLMAALVILLVAAGSYFFIKFRNEAVIDSMVVLPFENRSNDPSLDYLGEGLSESIINNLAQINSLSVVARTTAFRYKNQINDPLGVGHSLKVKAVLTGKIQLRGDTLIVQADLISVNDGLQLWGEQYSLKTDEAFTIQRHISREITEKLRLKLTSEQQQRLANQAVNPEAYENYLRGRYYWNRRTAEEIKKAIKEFQKAITIDPTYALPQAGLADAYVSLSSIQIPPNEAIPLAKAAAMRALELDGNLAEAHASLAAIKWRYDWNWDEAGLEFKRAIELNPNYPTARQWYGLFLIYLKQFDAGRAELLKAQQLDPLSLAINANVGLSYYFERRYESAIQHLRNTLELDRYFPYGHFFLGWALEQQHEFALAEEAFRRAAEIDQTPTTQAYLAHNLALQGKRAEAETILAKLEKKSIESYVSSYHLAVVSLGLGENEKALEMLQRGLAEHAESMVLLGVEPKFDRLRSDDRFKEISLKIGLNP
ncbi:MAG: BTAD domain-containing putative transcriptional regulator [Acidobacteriota bacterium]|nr:BTAD domain-containing putative transcriptional regulator [Acidobacteriota bacterium]